MDGRASSYKILLCRGQGEVYAQGRHDARGQGYPARGRGCLMGVLGLERGGFSLPGNVSQIFRTWGGIRSRGKIFPLFFLDDKQARTYYNVIDRTILS